MARFRFKSWQRTGDEPVAVQGSSQRLSGSYLIGCIRVSLQTPATSVGQADALDQNLLL